MPDTATTERPTLAIEEIRVAIRAAGRRIAPVWPLDRFVAVNPYFGLADVEFDEAAARLKAIAGARTTLPVAYYLAAFDAGRISADDVAGALATTGSHRADDVEKLISRCRGADSTYVLCEPSIISVARIASEVTGRDWSRLATERVADWAAAYFDAGQAGWRSANIDLRPYLSWKEEASADRTPEVMGLRGFRAVVRALPDDPVELVEMALAELCVPGQLLEPYLHALLLRVGGWAAHSSRITFEAELAGRADDDSVTQFLAVLVAWEIALYRTLVGTRLADAWSSALIETRPIDLADGLADELVLQDAFDRAERRRIVAQFAANEFAVEPSSERPEAQAVFCIDVRSEVFRRQLEANKEVDTVGFAGFFGFPISYVPIAHEQGSAQCPVLLTPGATVVEALDDPSLTKAAVGRRQLAHHVARAWKSFKMGAVTCFSFVGPVGLAYLPKLFTDSYGLTRPTRRADVEALDAWAIANKGPSLAVAPGSDGSGALGLPLDERVGMAEGALRGMSLRNRLAPLVLIAGHGSSTVNNPYGSGLNCGACGGNTGESNARVAAAVLNDPLVRSGLADRGVAVPDDTWFVAGLHDTTTDEVRLFDLSDTPASHATALERLSRQLGEASRAARAERASRLGISNGRDIDAAVMRRSKDWAEVRPEWGLAGCRAFVVAPRQRTRGLDLEGRAFLHSYDWHEDDGFAVLELILTAPVVVASWISLQYYASTVEPRLFGSGNKTLHNVVGRLGVLEGNGGDLRVGLPWQSVHDGEQFQHEPLRLNVIVEAPTEAMNAVLLGNEHIGQLCDNGWIHLLAMDDDGHIAQRYLGDQQWETLEVHKPAAVC